jgi:Domain of unknown function (DUF4832)/Domain of unknown function (DUF4874)
MPNPDRGFYGWSGADFLTSFEPSSVQAAYAAGQRLVLVPVVLGSYRNTDLPAAALTTLSQNFAALRTAGVKATLLFSYDFTAGGQDASAAQIKRHLEQLKPVLAANADVIPFMRAGFIGAWGEWHSSQAGNSCGYNAPANVTCAQADANRLIVRDALLANVPGTTQLGFRYPPDLRLWYPNPAQQQRAGIHNDCFLAGPTDSGTFDNPGDRDYAKTLTAQTAYGGELCDNAGTPVRDTCADILSEGAQYHLAWLNINFGLPIINRWKADGCFEQVSRSMGYRIQLDAASHATQASAGQTVPVTVDLRNVGWTKVFSPRAVHLSFKHQASGAVLTASGGNLQSLPPQASVSTRLTFNVTVPAGAAAGDYVLSLSVPDVFASTANDPRFAVRFANADDAAAGQAWVAANASFTTGTVLTVR